MAAYVIVDIAIHSPETYEEYKRLAPASIIAYGGRYLIRGGEVQIQMVVVEGAPVMVKG